jgi:uncharacterized DUF497 family protein
VNFEWDEEKRQSNVSKHGLDFTDAWEVFEGPMLTGLDEREDYGEERWIGIGLLRGLVVVIVFAERGEDTIRVISLRKGLKHERIKYEQAIRDGLEAS